MNDGGGAGVWIRDGVLHVIDVDFSGGIGASPGPDVAGGGIYAVGSLDVTVVGSRFENNTWRRTAADSDRSSRTSRSRTTSSTATKRSGAARTTSTTHAR